MTIEYELEFVDSLPQPLSEVDRDETSLGTDARQHLSEMRCITGPDVAEYGGDKPWIHVWRGTLYLDDVPAVRVSDDDSLNDKAKYAVDTLLTFFDGSCTPHGTDVDDFDWKVRVNSDPPPILSEGTYPIQIVWSPK